MEIIYSKHCQTKHTLLVPACISELKHMHSSSTMYHLCQTKLCLMCGQQLVQLPFTQQHALCESAVIFASGTAK